MKKIKYLNNYAYDYKQAVIDDVCEYYHDNEYLYVGLDKDDLTDQLNEDCWTNDRVTGNGSGTYTFNHWKAREYVIGNTELISSMVETFGIDDAEIGRHFLNEDWEWFDVSIRCYLLNQAVAELVNQLEEDGVFEMKTVKRLWKK